MLIKDGIVADKQLLSTQIVELPCLVLGRITNKDTLLSMRLEALSLVTLHMHIGKAAKDSEMGHSRLVSMPKLIRSAGLLESSC